jgi:hypothetical protein
LSYEFLGCIRRASLLAELVNVVVIENAEKAILSVQQAYKIRLYALFIGAERIFNFCAFAFAEVFVTAGIVEEKEPDHIVFVIFRYKVSKRALVFKRNEYFSARFRFKIGNLYIAHANALLRKLNNALGRFFCALALFLCFFGGGGLNAGSYVANA